MYDEVKENREEFQKRILRGMAPALRKDQLEGMEGFFNRLTDEQFWQFIEESRRRVGNASVQDYWKLTRKMMEKNHVTVDNCGLNSNPLEVMSREDAEDFWNEIGKSHPSDYICLTREEDYALMQLWEKGKKGVTIPSDIFFAGTVSLTDFRVTVDETMEPDGTIIPFRVVVFPDYAERIAAETDGMPVPVGAVIPGNFGRRAYCIPMLVMRGFDSILFGPVAFREYDEEFIRYMQKSMTIADMGRAGTMLLETWYGIQIALLHPQVKDVFRHGHKEKDREEYKNRKPGEKKAVRYIRRHVINKDELEDAMYGTGRKYARHTLVWYVIGHWRNLSNGMKSFVNPYWKGPLRELKKAVPVRDREIAIGGAADA